MDTKSPSKTMRLNFKIFALACLTIEKWKQLKCVSLTDLSSWYCGRYTTTCHCAVVNTHTMTVRFNCRQKTACHCVPFAFGCLQSTDRQLKNALQYDLMWIRVEHMEWFSNGIVATQRSMKKHKLNEVFFFWFLACEWTHAVDTRLKRESVQWWHWNESFDKWYICFTFRDWWVGASKRREFTRERRHFGWRFHLFWKFSEMIQLAFN